jgi:hypothetical protein
LDSSISVVNRTNGARIMARKAVSDSVMNFGNTCDGLPG